MPVRLLGGALVKWLGGGTIVAVVLGGVGFLYHGYQTNRLERAVTEAEATVLLHRSEAVDLRSRVSDLQRDLGQWQAAADESQARAEALREELQASRDTVRNMNARLAAGERAYRALNERIRAAPAEADGPVAPVLRDTLEALP
ncbi:hypothetical protein E4656_13685 [Natronospirillum operosum]|uniref:Uncharacterized protein n=1 Tax=Natronospirillum operosum TaxID=2759953 RepID=A0A4Z0W4S0_9GAMM|nr:hypothetical protein [Natronospirillum operosum]TGG92517.1 hypothetical protein E4656_13685 [Natronospirillum operosum]